MVFQGQKLIDTGSHCFWINFFLIFILYGAQLIYKVMLVWGTWQSNPLWTHVSCTDRQTTEPPGKPTQFFFFFLISSEWLGHIDQDICTLKIPDVGLLWKLSRSGKTGCVFLPGTEQRPLLWGFTHSCHVSPPWSHLGLGPLQLTSGVLATEQHMAKTGAQRKSKGMPKGLQEVSVLMNLEPSLFRQLTSPHTPAGAATDYFQLNLSNVTILPRTLMPLRLFQAVVKPHTIFSPFLINVHNRSEVGLTP